jgi:hypothetical protein
MLMALLTRRLQVLLDEERFDQLEQLAQRRRTTVAALVRAALDRTLAEQGMARDQAADRFLNRPAVDFGPWEDLKSELDEALERALPR